VAKKSGSKAELDKDGIPLSPVKAELDKDGIPLKEASEARPAEAEAGAPTAQPALAPALVDKLLKHKKWLIIGLSAAAGLIIIIVTVTILLSRSDEEPAEPAAAPAPAPAVAPAPADQLTLEPFILSYKPLDKQHEGVLIARINLKIDPEDKPNVQSRIYQIRSLIFESLAKNAALYEQADLRDILARDLKPLGVRDVTFASFEQR
jgi:pyruvate/2-oxoglutarate dehydrogenase complex dihydrolipoamide acyltransferase (E2) component